MLSADGELFEVAIPTFSLDLPNAEQRQAELRRACSPAQGELSRSD